MKIDVRRITAQEYEAARRLLLRVTETDTGADWQHEEEGYPLCMLREDLSSGETMGGFTESGELAAYFRGQWDCEQELEGKIPWRVQGPAYYIHRLAVDPEFQRRGIASAMVSAAESRARAGGARSVRMETAGTNRAADRLYRKLGYPVLGSFPNPWTDSGPILCYEKPLEAAGTEEPFDSPAAEGYSLR